MRDIDKVVFKAAAQSLRSWILVRRTNPESLKYIGKPGYTPKPISCKAKTAKSDVTKYKVAGLVVSPILLPAAFPANGSASAIKCWSHTATLVRNSPAATTTGFSIIENTSSPHYGCLMVNGMLVHGDYDLYDVVNVKYKRSNLALVETIEIAPNVDMVHMKGYLVDSVAKYVNDRIGSPMVQHGGEAQFAPEITNQILDVFTPDGRWFELMSDVEIRDMYKTTFEGRQVIGR
jgi:hypothetical protein